MVQVQIRIYVKDDGTVQQLYEILPREDASEHELKIAQSLQGSFEAITAKVADVAGVKMQMVKITAKDRGRGKDGEA